jgi:hypothetical protein
MFGTRKSTQEYRAPIPDSGQMISKLFKLFHCLILSWASCPSRPSIRITFRTIIIWPAHKKPEGEPCRLHIHSNFSFSKPSGSPLGRSGGLCKNLLQTSGYRWLRIFLYRGTQNVSPRSCYLSPATIWSYHLIYLQPIGTDHPRCSNTNDHWLFALTSTYVHAWQVARLWPRADCQFGEQTPNEVHCQSTFSSLNSLKVWCSPSLNHLSIRKETNNFLGFQILETRLLLSTLTSPNWEYFGDLVRSFLACSFHLSPSVSLRWRNSH